MMQIWKKHWPIVVMVIVWVASLVRIWNAGADAGEGIALWFLLFGILIPVVCLITSVWYGYQMRSPWKWVIPVVCGLLGLLSVGIVSRDWDFTGAWIIGLMNLVPAVVGMVVGSWLGKRKNG